MSLAELIAETHQRVAVALETVRAARLAVEARTLAIEALASPVEPGETEHELDPVFDPDFDDDPLWAERLR